MDKRERVARAIAETDWAYQECGLLQLHWKMADAAIAALEPVTVQEAALMLADHIDNDTEAASRMIEAYVSITSLDTLVSHWLSQCIRALAERGE